MQDLEFVADLRRFDLVDFKKEAPKFKREAFRSIDNVNWYTDHSNLIEYDESWLEMLGDRNLTLHIGSLHPLQAGLILA